MQASVIMELKELFKQNPNAKPSILIANHLSNKVLSSAPEDEIYQLVLAQVHSWVLGNIKAAAQEEGFFPLQSSLSDIISLLKVRFVEDLPMFGLVLQYHKSSLLCVKEGCDYRLTVGESVKLCSGCGKDENIKTGELIFISSKHALKTMTDMTTKSPGSLWGRSCHVS